MISSKMMTKPATQILFCLVGLTLLFCLSTNASAEHPREQQRSIGDYRGDVKTFMKLSKSKDQQVQRNAIFNLCALHHELVSDSRFRTSTKVQSFRVVVAKRLETYSKKQLKQLKRHELAAAKRAKLAKRNSDPLANESKKPGTQSQDERQADQVAQPEYEFDAILQSASDSYDSLGQFSGGPAQVFNYAGGRIGGAPWDHGQSLVDLIQNTIDPTFWRDNGGNGTIYYYRPSRVLVINASQRIHELTEDLLWKLRAAN